VTSLKKTLKVHTSRGANSVRGSGNDVGERTWEKKKIFLSLFSKPREIGIYFACEKESHGGGEGNYRGIKRGNGGS